jgi:hypothetical protein
VKITLLSLLFVFLFACTEQNVTNSVDSGVDDVGYQEIITPDFNDSSQTKQIVVDVKKVQFFMPEEVVVLQKYTTDSVIFFMDWGVVNYFELNQDSTFLDNLLMLHYWTKRFIDNVRSSAYAPYNSEGISDEFGFLQFAIPFYLNTCVAECSEYGVDWDMNELQARVKKTQGTLDDEFIELLWLANGERMSLTPYFLAWFNQTWDYGGSSLLGNMSMYTFLKKVQQFAAKSTRGTELLNFYKDNIYQMAIHGCYDKMAVQILEEIKLITNEQLLGEEQVGQLKQLVEIIKGGSNYCGFCLFKNIQLNCEEENCNYGG